MKRHFTRHIIENENTRKTRGKNVTKYFSNSYWVTRRIAGEMLWSPSLKLFALRRSSYTMTLVMTQRATRIACSAFVLKRTTRLGRLKSKGHNGFAKVDKTRLKRCHMVVKFKTPM